MAANQQALFMVAPSAGVTYATWNPADKGAGITLSGGNLVATTSTTAASVRATIGKSSGKWYWEYTVTNTTTLQIGSGVGTASASLAGTPGVVDNLAWGYVALDGKVYNNGTTAATYVTYTNPDVIGVALDMDSGTLQFYKNNTLQGTAATGLTGTYYPMVGGNNTSGITANFGASAMTYTAPSGFTQGLY